MPAIFLYMVKLSVSLSLVYLFYHFVLRRLTFYNWNRFYLLCYTVISFLIPFINITPVLERNDIADSQVIRFIPSVGNINYKLTDKLPAKTAALSWTSWDWLLVFILTGIAIMLIRLFTQLFSFKKIIKKAKLVSDKDVKLYQVDQPIIPFSFGSSIFINQQLHNDDELSEIIRHEFVHVKQKHTTDIIWSELLCILNWYNPFVWIIRKAIRQNLEFIADNKVLQSGIDKKQYQFLLLKVIGNNHFSIASQFNFSSLKKRIAMMNKMKSARGHIVKFLFVSPLMAILLVAFRNNNDKGLPVKTPVSFTNEKKSIIKENEITRGKINDTVPNQISPNSKGYFIDMTGNKENCIVIVKDKNHKEIKHLLLTEWNKKKEYYENLYGPTPVEAVSARSNVITMSTETDSSVVERRGLTYTTPVEPVEVKNFKSITLEAEGYATVLLKNGKTIRYDLNYGSERRIFEEKYGGEISLRNGINPVTVTGYQIDEKLKPGFVTGYQIDEKLNPGFVKGYQINNNLVPVIVEGKQYVAEVSRTAVPALATVKGDIIEVGVSSIADIGNVEGDILLDITGDMPESRVREMVAELKSRGYDFIINSLEYRNDKIFLLKGSISGRGSKKNFEASDFSRFTISDVKKDNGKNEFNFYVGHGSLKWQ